MDNLDKLLKSKDTDKILYSKKEKRTLREKSLGTLGVQYQLVICMEEIAELIDVISSNINDKFDYIHTAEELVDVKICTDYIMQIYGIKESERKKSKRKITKKTYMLSVGDLSKAQMKISKLIRYKDGAEDNLIDIIEYMLNSVEELTTLFKIKRKDANKIENLKYARLEQRLVYGKLS